MSSARPREDHGRASPVAGDKPRIWWPIVIDCVTITLLGAWPFLTADGSSLTLSFSTAAIFIAIVATLISNEPNRLVMNGPIRLVFLLTLFEWFTTQIVRHQPSRTYTNLEVAISTMVVVIPLILIAAELMFCMRLVKKQRESSQMKQGSKQHKRWLAQSGLNFARAYPEITRGLEPLSALALDLLCAEPSHELIRTAFSDTDQGHAATVESITSMLQDFGTSLMSASDDLPVKETLRLLSELPPGCRVIVSTSSVSAHSDVFGGEEASESFASDFIDLLYGNTPTTRRHSTRISSVMFDRPQDYSSIFKSIEMDVGPLIASIAYRELKARLLRLSHEPYMKLISRSIGVEVVGETGTRLGPAALEQVAQEISWTPPAVFHVSPDRSDTFTNQLKVFGESHLGSRWDWWPLAPRQYPLQNGFRRIGWSLPSGTVRRLDLPKENFDSLLSTLRIAPGFMRFVGRPRPNSQSSGERCYNLVAKLVSLALDELLPRFRELAQPAPADSHGNVPRRQTRIIPSLRQRFSDHSNESDGSGHVDRRLGVESEDISVRNSRHLYLCTTRGGRSFRPSCVRLDGERTDRDLFRQLKVQYNAARGFRRRCLSIWRFSHCEFYRISKHGINACHPQAVGFPSDDDFDGALYDAPKPPSPSPPDGPISETEFRDRFHRCDSNFFTWWKAWESMFGIENSFTAYRVLPKRTEPIELETAKKEVFFGLYAREQRSFFWIMAWLFICLATPFAFFFLWLYIFGKPSELPSAFVPLGGSLTLVTILITHLINTREDK